MKKLLTVLEDLWVAVAFAEAGEYEFLLTDKVKPRYRATAPDARPVKPVTRRIRV